MDGYTILHACVVGISLTLVSIFTTDLLGLATTRVYHKDPPRRVNAILTLIYLVTTSLFIFLILVKTDFLFSRLLTVWLMAGVAQMDLRFGRIPIVFLLLSVVLGISSGLFHHSVGYSLMGGLVNLFVSGGIYGLGRKFEARNDLPLPLPSNPVFGLGDVYVTGAVGFLLGYPGGFQVLLLGLILSIISAGLNSVVRKVAFLSQHVRLGLYFYIATVGYLLLLAVAPPLS